MQPIKTEADYDTILAEIDGLMNAEPDTPEGDRLEVLVALVQAYEAKQHPVPPPDPVSALLFRMEQLGLSRKDLEAYLGPSSRVSDVLNRRRELSMAQARRLHTGLGIPADVLLGNSK